MEHKEVRFGYSEPTDQFSVETLKANKDLSIQLEDLLFTKQFCFMLIEPVTQKIVYSNEASQLFYGYTEEELSNIPYYEIHDVPWGRVSSLFALSKFQRRKHYFTTQKRKDGSLLHVEVFFGPLTIGNDDLFYVFVRDLTKNREAELKLKKSERQNQLLFENFKFPLICLELNFDNYGKPSLVITKANKAFEKMIRLTKEELVSMKVLRPILDVFKEQFDLPEIVKKVLQYNETVDIELSLKTKPIFYSVCIYKADDNVIAAIFEDITSQKRLDSLRNEFVNTLTHEIRTPMTSIKAGIDFWIENPDSDLIKSENLPGIIKNNINRLSNIVNDVLDYQKFDSVSSIESYTKQPINKVILNVADSIKPLLNEKKLDFHTNLDNNIESSFFNKEHIARVLINILNNGIKFTEKGSLTIQSKLVRSWIEVCISDTGPGIKPELLEKIFISFYRAHSISVKGTGLGLSISKKIVEQHGGTIWIESKVGEGSQFYFTIPYLKEIPK